MRYNVTVSIVNYNDYKRASVAIRSILEHTRGIKIKIYVIDNASTDDSIEKLAAEFSAIDVVFCDKNLGYGRANNVILSKIDSEYHAVLNPDIILYDDIFTELYGFMQKNPDIGMCTPAVYFTNGDPQHLPKRNPKLKYLIANRLPLKQKWEQYRQHYKMLDEDLSNVTDIEFASGCFMFCRTELLVKIGGFDERYFMYFEDADLTRTFRKYARVVFYPYAKIYHDYKRDSAKKLKYLLIHINSMFKYFLKWKGDGDRS
ncbi:MAG: glycosyltransferase family 2 protein [Christensenellaceae bacterium]